MMDDEFRVRQAKSRARAYDIISDADIKKWVRHNLKMKIIALVKPTIRGGNGQANALRDMLLGIFYASNTNKD